MGDEDRQEARIDPQSEKISAEKKMASTKPGITSGSRVSTCAAPLPGKSYPAEGIGGGRGEQQRGHRHGGRQQVGVAHAHRRQRGGVPDLDPAGEGKLRRPAYRDIPTAPRGRAWPRGRPCRKAPRSQIGADGQQEARSAPVLIVNSPLDAVPRTDLRAAARRSGPERISRQDAHHLPLLTRTRPGDHGRHG